MIDREDGEQRPCLALMGEFSAGKSTLANLLIGSDPLPVQVIATQLPPVVISHGSASAYSVGLDGTRRTVDVTNLAALRMEDIAYLQIFCEEDLLLQCDLMDMPGISDPNMDPEVWERMIGQADGVLWCSHATQAWRQSEAAVWSELSEDLHDRSLLLLTRIDKLQSQADRDRVVARVEKETRGLFRAVLPISLLLATREQEDYELWSQSGAEAFASALVELLQDLNGGGGQIDEALESRAEVSLPGLEAPERPPIAARAPGPVRQDSDGPRVVPRRVRASGMTPRPPL